MRVDRRYEEPNAFEFDHKWERQHLPLALDILGSLPARLLTAPRVAPREMDIKQNADGLLLPFGGKNVAFRLRRPGYFWRRSSASGRAYGLQFTIRSERRRTGAETELAKIRRGLGDWFLYGHIENGWAP